MFEETGSQEEKVEASVYLSTVSDPSKNNSCWSSPHQAFETHPGFLLTERMQVPWLSGFLAGQVLNLAFLTEGTRVIMKPVVEQH